MNTIAYSSEVYLIKAADIKPLSKDKAYYESADIVIKLYSDDEDKIISGYGQLASTEDESFVEARFVYDSIPQHLGFFVHILKPFKRRFYKQSSGIYTTKLSDLLRKNLLRGIRDKNNAYQLTNSKYRISHDEAQTRYTELYNAIKESGYKKEFPMFVALNRKLGVKDQLLQGHHRVGICQELGVEDVSISFWYLPHSFKFIKLFLPKKKE